MNPCTLKTSRGFTLIELMITVAIIGILAAVAYPSYRDSVLRARRGEGRAALTRAIQAQERFYSGNNFYALTANGNFTTANGFSTSSNPSSATPAYNLTATGSTTLCTPLGGSTALNQCVLITATATQADPLCATMTIDSAGNKLPAACW